MYYWDSELLEADYGVPVDIVPRLEQQQGQEGQEQQDETSSMVVIREWSKATVRYDCSEEGKGGTIACDIFGQSAESDAAVVGCCVRVLRGPRRLDDHERE
jgi:hypothetical protein